FRIEISDLPRPGNLLHDFKVSVEACFPGMLEACNIRSISRQERFLGLDKPEKHRSCPIRLNRSNKQIEIARESGRGGMLCPLESYLGRNRCEARRLWREYRREEIPIVGVEHSRWPSSPTKHRAIKRTGHGACPWRSQMRVFRVIVAEQHGNHVVTA